MTLMKSKRPRVDHCSLTEAPSCSISLLTSRMRDGLFLTVWTTSGVRVVSMMYVGMSRRLNEQRGEVRQAAVPAAVVRRSGVQVGEATVGERELGPVAERLELDGHERLDVVGTALLPAP